MLYKSTRGNYRPVSPAEAVTLGIAPDGGLFVPGEQVSILPEQLTQIKKMAYNQKATFILKPFLTDFSTKEIEDCACRAYSEEKFDTAEIAPLIKLDGQTYILELWHGPTCAFKDMALQILPHLLLKAAAKTGDNAGIVILVATSGDTGKAALEGFKDVAGTKIIVFYPAEGVSEIQKRQMVTQKGGNISVIAVRGNFDDAQNGVKSLFGDGQLIEELRRQGYKFSSANSINWGRLVPQIVYYFSAYLDLLAKGEITPGEKINFTVPTGNFGNILAAFYARQMGLPVHRLICAANTNDVLADFIRSGVYSRNRPFYKTISPSMDILISSNLERLLYELNGHDQGKVREWMAGLKENGEYTVDTETHKRIKETFWSDQSNDAETLETIKDTYIRYRYVVDTHTAVAVSVLRKYLRATGDTAKNVVVSTASPFKFNASVARAILGEEAIKNKSEFDLLEMVSEATGMTIPAGLRDLDKKPVLYTTVIAKEEMGKAVKEILIPNAF